MLPGRTDPQDFTATFERQYPACAGHVCEPSRFVLFRAKDLYYPDGRFCPHAMDRGLHAFYAASQRQGPRNVRATAEMIWALEAIPGIEHLMACESRLNYFIPGKPWISICLYDLTRLSGATIMKVVQTHHENEIVTRSGERRVVSWNNTPLMGIEGTIAGVASIGEDITERKQAEDEREKLQLRLVQAQKMESVGRSAGGVAHDFNNMLGAILGNTSLALMGLPLDSPLRENLTEIEKCARRSADLTRQLLAFARKQTVTPRVLDLNATVEGMLKLLRRLIGESIDLTWTPAPDLWPVRIDPSQIDQILANLCLNARDAIQVASEPTHGATFHIYLPRHTAAVAPVSPTDDAPTAHGHRTILLVEDEPSLLRIGQRVLRNLGYTVLAASTPG